MTTDEKVKTKSKKQVERAVIADALKDKLVRLAEQANAALQGIATVTKSDIVNLILGAHSGDLSPAEVDQLKALHLDQVKYAFWIAKRLKEARAAGETLSLQDVLVMSQPLMGDGPARAPRRPRKKKDAPEVASDAVTPTTAE